MKRERQPSAILARVEMLASVVLDAYAVSTEPEPLEAEPPTIPPKQRLKLAKTAKKQKVQPSPRPAAEELAEVRPAASEGSCSTEASDLEPAPVPDSVPEPLQPLKHLRDCPPPSIDELRAAGYLETEDTVRRVWSWAKEHEPTDMVWPTPTAGVQEALRFDACGWPNGKTTTIDQWLGMIQYWTVLREQLITGAPRRARNSVNLGRR